MSENNIVCPFCNTQNDVDYSYCINCGASLKSDLEQNIGGFPVAEVADYIGNNSEKYIPKFKKFQRFGKSGWNWPVFLFSLLLNIPFVWFFYRKMYKIGAIVLAVSLAITVAHSACVTYFCSAVANYFPDIFEISFAAQQGALQPELAEQMTTELIEQIIVDLQSRRGFVTCSYIIEIIGYLKFGLALVYSIFADYWYYKKAMNDLKKLNVDGPPSAIDVVTKGGKNTASGVLTGIFVSIVQGMILFIPTFSIFITQIFEVLEKFSL